MFRDLEKRVGLDVRNLNKEVLIKVKYATRSSRNQLIENAFTDLIALDEVKKRVFFMSKSIELKAGFFSRKNPKSFELKKLFSWAKAKGEYDEWDVLFAWKYDDHDEIVLDYIPLDNVLECEPSEDHIEVLTLSSVKDGSAFKLRVKNIHESLQRLSRS